MAQALGVGRDMRLRVTPVYGPSGHGLNPLLPEGHTFRQVLTQVGALPSSVLTPDPELDGGRVQGSAPGKARAEATGEGGVGSSSPGWGHHQLRTECEKPCLRVSLGLFLHRHSYGGGRTRQDIAGWVWESNQKEGS